MCFSIEQRMCFYKDVFLCQTRGEHSGNGLRATTACHLAFFVHFAYRKVRKPLKSRPLIPAKFELRSLLSVLTKAPCTKTTKNSAAIRHRVPRLVCGGSHRGH